MKKFVAFLVCFLVVFSLVGCKSIKNDPISMARKLIEEDYQVTIILDDGGELYDDVMDLLDCTTRGVYCCIMILAEDNKGSDELAFLLYCETTKDARALEKDLDSFMDDSSSIFKKGISKRIGKMCYVGCSDAFDDLKL